MPIRLSLWSWYRSLFSLPLLYRNSSLKDSIFLFLMILFLFFFDLEDFFSKKHKKTGSKECCTSGLCNFFAVAITDSLLR